MLRYLLLALCTLVLIGCEQKSEKPVETEKQPAVQLQPLPEVTQKPLSLLKDPIEAVLVESAAEAIPTWRKYASAKPTLVLMAQNPQLQPIPNEVKEEAIKLSRAGSLEDFQRNAAANSANPTILPHMALSAALDADLFSKVVWVLPVKKDSAFTVESFRQQMLNMGDLSDEEAASFKLDNGSFVGMVRGTPLQATPLYALKPLEGPLLLHLDLGFFPPLYNNEIKTPLHALVYATLKALREQQLSVAAVSLSQANLSGDLPLKVRFLGDLIIRVLQSPELLDQPLQTNDARRNEALYLGNFFQKEKILDLYLQMQNDAPDDAAVQYDLYQTTRQFRQGNQALEYLSQAVALDPRYALEYLDLASVALEKQRPDEAIRMLNLATPFFPENPFILLNLAEINLSIGHTDRSREIVEELRQRSWSEVYNPDIDLYLNKLLVAADDRKQPASTNQ